MKASSPSSSARNSRMRLGLAQVASTVLGLAALAWLLQALDWRIALEAIRNTSVALWTLATIGLVLSHLFRAGRIHHEWRTRLPMSRLQAWQLSVRHSAWVVLSPLRAGEGIYLWTLNRTFGVGLREAGTSLIKMRLQDALILMVIAAGAFGPGPLPGRILLMLSLALVLAIGLPRVLPGFRFSSNSWAWAAANWSVKLGAIGALLAGLAPLDRDGAWTSALGGEIAAALPLQPPAGMGTYEAGVILGAQWHGGLPWEPLASAALAVHLLMVLTTVTLAFIATWIRTDPKAARPALALEPLGSKPMPDTMAFDHLPAHQLSVVVPMYNERDNASAQIDDIVLALKDYPAPWEIIVVDDGSSDGTPQVLRAHARAVGTHVRVIELRRNFRQTAAMQAGIDAARGSVIVTMDGDRQNDPRDIPRLVYRLLHEDLDLVAGWRQHRRDGLLIRKLPSWVANRLIRRVSGLQFQDLGCSLKAFRASVLREIRLYGEMHRFIPAWLATVTSPNRMAEEPVRHHSRRAGRSKYGISRTFRVMVDLLAMVYFLRFGTRPGHFFGGIGLVFGSLGVAILGYLALLKLLGESIGGRPLLWLGFLLVIASVQLLTTGVLAEILMRSYVDRLNARSYHVRDASDLPSDDQGWQRPQ